MYGLPVETNSGDVVGRVRVAYGAHLVNATIVVQPLIRVRVLGEVKVPGLYLAGNYRGGPGINDCVVNGLALARRLA